MPYKDAVPVVEVASALWLIAADGTDKPKLAWQAADGFRKAGKGSLWREAERMSDAEKTRYHELIDAWLRNSQNDCLRARGDVRWRTACRAEMLLRPSGRKGE